MKASELRERSTEDLRHALEEASRELFNLRFQKASGQLTNPQRPGEVRREIARIKTLLRERELMAGEVR
jgi:large subunit ribosomal protein L29